MQAGALGIDGITCIEFGVAGGNGLLAMESISKRIEAHFRINCDVVGFDLGSGLSEPQDYRDLPYAWRNGMFEMNEKLLRDKLTAGKLIIGDVKSTVKTFMASDCRYPLGFISFDLDFYSSTKAALDIFDVPDNLALPRVFTYFDDIIGGANEFHCEEVGELAAIREYNQAQQTKKLLRINGLAHKRPIPSRWNDCIFVHHNFGAENYSKFLELGQKSKLELAS